MAWGQFLREHFLEKMVKDRGFRYGAELGVWRGRVFLHLLETCPDLNLIGVDVWEPLEGGMEEYANWPHEEYEREVREGAKKYGDRAIIIKATTHEAVARVAGPEPWLDFIFVDADHRYDAVKQDLEDWEPKVRSGGVVAGHDINWSGVLGAVTERYGHYNVGPDNVWWVEKS